MKARTHHLKTVSSVYDDVARGIKTFEYRKNDRDFALGDHLVLQEYDPSCGALNQGDYVRQSPLGKINEIEVRVTYILHGGRFGIPNGYCIMQFEKEPT